MPRRPVPHRRLLVDQISVGIMLHHVPCRVPPVVEYLASENVSANAPDRPVLLLRQPLVAEGLGVEVVDLEAAVVRVRFGAGGEGRHEHGVVVDQILAPVHVREDGDVLASRAVAVGIGAVQGDVEQVAGDEVEVLGVKGHRRVEVLHAESEVTKLEGKLLSKRLA